MRVEQLYARGINPGREELRRARDEGRGDVRILQRYGTVVRVRQMVLTGKDEITYRNESVAVVASSHLITTQHTGRLHEHWGGGRARASLGLHSTRPHRSRPPPPHSHNHTDVTHFDGPGTFRNLQVNQRSGADSLEH